jgi:HAD superfamily hydrolase (TIGR01450 family)
MLLLVDLDGVVYRGSNPVPGVAAVLADRVAKGDDVVYVTNNSMFYRSAYAERLQGMGAPLSLDRVVTSARATALYLRERLPDVRRVLVVGASGLEREMRDVGLEVVTAAHAATRSSQEGIDGFAAAGQPHAVVVGLDPQLTYGRIAVAADAIRAGARFIATNRDPTYPAERGLLPGAGSVVAAIEVAAGTKPEAEIGKPGPLLLLEAAKAVGRPAADAVMIGDAPTDLVAARAAGARGILMLTGVTSRERAAEIHAADPSTLVAENAADLARALESLARG